MYLYCSVKKRLLLILPTLIIFGIFTLYPIADCLITSMCTRYGISPKKWYGFGNYIEIFKDNLFMKSALNTLIITVGMVLCIVIFGYLLGNMISKTYKGSGIFKATSFLPYVVSGIMAALLWYFILDPNMGLINAFFREVGLEEFQPLWIGGKTLTPYSVVLVNTWKQIGYFAIMFMSGIKMMPKDCLEAADIDGANTFQKTMRVVIPTLKETFKTVTVLVIIQGINSYHTVKMLTGGAPAMLSNTLATYTYETMWKSLDFGQGSAMATIIMILAMTISIGVLGVTRNKSLE